jgi:hypothetical protein
MQYIIVHVKKYLIDVEASSLGTFIACTDVWTAWWLGVGHRVFLAWRPRWSGVPFTTTMTSLDGSRRPACDDGREKEVVMSGVMVASMEGMTKFMRIFTL